MPHIPNHPSAIKRHRQSERRQARNRLIKARVHTAVKRVSDALAANDTAAAKEALRLATKALSQAAAKGPLHRNTAARKVGRLSARLHRATAASKS
ncbi:MAG TPA: 30S ribosomal protein S20 [Candidatus Binataceae bacterium]|nr:30S ribosomal protein S20 [Candidatus Binataceae bacterium]